MFGLGRNLTLESFPLSLLVSFFYRNNIFEENEHLFQKVQSSLEVQKTKEKFPDSHGHNILEPYNVLLKTQVATSKTKLDIWYKTLDIRVASQITKRHKTYDLREYRKSQTWVETQSSIQSSFQKLNFGNSSQKTRKVRYQTFLFLSNLLGSSNLFQIVCPGLQYPLSIPETKF